MRWRKAVVAAACATAAVVAGGCATSGYDAGKLRSQLEGAGATPQQASCVVEGLSNKYAESQLGSHSAPSEREYAYTRELLAQCKVNLPLQPPP
jgi:hypothetical protein